jgi:hypothetical protein
MFRPLLRSDLIADVACDSFGDILKMTIGLDRVAVMT